MAHLLDSIKTWITGVIPFGVGGYSVIFLLMLLESACIPIPSEITMVFAGFLASNHHLSLIPVIAVGVVANLAGSLLSYYVGRSGARGLLVRYGKFVLIKPHDVERAEVWFSRYGQSAVFFSRMLPLVRTFISLPAGVAKMDIKKFSLLTVLGCIPWVTALTVAGYYLGRHWNDALKYTRPLEYLVIAGVVALVALWLLRRRKASEAAV